MMIWMSWSKASCRHKVVVYSANARGMFHEIHYQVSREKWKVTVQLRAYLKMHDDVLELP
jgi:hypothetical protein